MEKPNPLLRLFSHPLSVIIALIAWLAALTFAMVRLQDNVKTLAETIPGIQVTAERAKVLAHDNQAAALKHDHGEMILLTGRLKDLEAAFGEYLMQLPREGDIILQLQEIPAPADSTLRSF